MTSGFNLLDLIFISFTLIFVVTAFLRGFVKEVFSLFNWVISLVLSYALAPYVSKALGSYSDNKVVIDISARIIIFVLVFIATALATSGLCKALKEKMPGVFDKSLGVFYGIVKTLLIFGFMYSVTTSMYGFLLNKKIEAKSADLPQWLTGAKSYNILRISGEALDPFVGKFMDAILENFESYIPKKPENLDEKIDEVIEKSNELPATPNEVSKALEDSGYSKKDIEKMNRLMDIIEKK